MNAQKASKQLLILSLVLLVIGFTASAVYWSISDTPAFLAEQENYAAAIAEANRRNSANAPQLMNEQWQRVTKSARLVEAHGHFLFLCILLLLFSLLMAGCRPMARVRRHITWLAGGGILIYPAGLIVQAAGQTFVGQVLAAGGALMILAFAGIVTIGVWHDGRGSSQQSN